MERKPASADQVVGSRLRLRRRQAATTKERLAEILDVPVEDIPKYENGVARLGATRLSKASRALDAPISYFFAPVRATALSDAGHASAEDLLAEPGADELLSAYSRIASPQLRGVVLKLTRHLAQESRESASPIQARALLRGGRSASPAR